ncbi:MAG: LamG-like jellyroll fold domain-containing protein [Acidobacteriota bacterium]
MSRRSAPRPSDSIPRRIVSRCVRLLLIGIVLLACTDEPRGTAQSAGAASGGARPAEAATTATSTAGANAGAETGDPAALGDGFVVWESNRSGAWRLWARALAGVTPQQLTADEAGRAHCCAHVAPDGRHLVYLSLPQGQERYPRDGAQGILRLVTLERDADGADRPRAASVRDLGPARTYFEHRAAVWRDSRRIIVIDGDGRTRELDINVQSADAQSADAQSAGRILVEQPSPRHGWLLDPTLRFATQGSPTFSLYDPERRAVVERPSLGGCQPYFTTDGRLGLWIAGAGGPLRAFDLENRTETTILAKSDPRLPPPYGYLYFPMPSHDARLLAFGASDGSHDHQQADYEVFVAETDPRTLELVGPVVRITEHPSTDRFPDVWAEPLTLGRIVAEAPLTRSFEVPESLRAAGPWHWQIDASDAGTGDTLEHRFTDPGRYEISARSDDPGAPVLRGSVRLRPARSPKLREADVRRDGREIHLRFDEPVRVYEASARLESGRELTAVGLDADRGLTWILRVDGAPMSGPDAVLVAGVTDRAEEPNRLAETRVVLEPPRWPSARDGLALLWHTGDRTNTITGPDGVGQASLFERRGAAWFDRDYRMVLRGGSYLAGMDTMQRLLGGARARNEMTLEVTVTAEQARTDGRATIFTFSSGLSRRNFTLAQEGTRYTWRLNTPTTGDNGDRPVVDLGAVRAGTPQHLVVAYRPGHLDAWIDGEQTVASADLQSGFFHWRELPLLVGAEWPDQLSWRGRVEALAVYARALGGDEVAENGRRLAAERVRRKAPEMLVVRARLTARSAPPRLEEIAPYRDALGVFDYEVVEVLGGRWQRPRLRVAHRLLVDGETTPIHTLEPGTVLTLTLEPHSAQPQLEALVVADDLATDPGVPLWFSDRIRP